MRFGWLPSMVVAPGVRTGVTRMSLPTSHCLSTVKSSGSLGNSKNNAFTGGRPAIDALAKSVYFAIVVNGVLRGWSLHTYPVQQ